MSEPTCEVDDFATGLDSFDQAETDNDPGGGQTTHQVKLEASHVFPGSVLMQTKHRPLEIILAREDPGIDLQYMAIRVSVMESLLQPHSV